MNGIVENIRLRQEIQAGCPEIVVIVQLQLQMHSFSHRPGVQIAAIALSALEVAMIALALTCPILEATSPISHRSKPSACNAVLYRVIRFYYTGHSRHLGINSLMQLAVRCFPKAVVISSSPEHRYAVCILLRKNSFSGQGENIGTAARVGE